MGAFLRGELHFRDELTEPGKAMPLPSTGIYQQLPLPIAWLFPIKGRDLARIAYIWEFGGGLGHLTTALPLANAYRDRGHEVSFIVSDVASAAVVIPPDYPVFQAPVWHPAKESVVTRPISYAEILLGKGFGIESKLIAMVRSWIHLLQAMAPDLLVLDFSPTAMLAAQILGLRHCTIGHGFFLPPKEVPVPGFIPSADAERLRRSEQALLRSINAARTTLGAGTLNCFADFFQADLDLLTTWPELEHYPTRQSARYWGPVLMRVGGKPPVWKQTGLGRLFVYLYGHYPKLEEVLQAIDASGVEALIYAPGISDALLKRYANERMTISKEMYDMGQVLAEADALICHGSFGTVWEGLLAGVPMLCLPVHMEQFLATSSLTSLGAAIQLGADAAKETMVAAIRDLLQQPDFSRSAESIAKKYGNYDPAAQINELVDAGLLTIHGRLGNST